MSQPQTKFLKCSLLPEAQRHLAILPLMCFFLYTSIISSFQAADSKRLISTLLIHTQYIALVIWNPGLPASEPGALFSKVLACGIFFLIRLSSSFNFFFLPWQRKGVHFTPRDHNAPPSMCQAPLPTKAAFLLRDYKWLSLWPISCSTFPLWKRIPGTYMGP